MSYKDIVFLASYPKSGNTWVRCFLDAYFLGEIDINELVCSISDDGAARHQNGVVDTLELPAEMQGLTRHMALLRLIATYQANKVANVPLFVKTHVPNLVINGVDMMPTPVTKAIIYLVRDPLEVLPSFANHFGLEMDKAAEYMGNHTALMDADPVKGKVAQFLGSWDNHVNSFYGDDSKKILVLKYEDMLKDPVKCFSLILETSGIEPNAEQVKKALDIVELSKLHKQEQEKGFAEESLNNKGEFFGKKKKEVPEYIKIRMKKKFSRIMKRLGYLNSGRKAA
jgi:hypothetical protein